MNTRNFFALMISAAVLCGFSSCDKDDDNKQEEEKQEVKIENSDSFEGYFLASGSGQDLMFEKKSFKLEKKSDGIYQIVIPEFTYQGNSMTMKEFVVDSLNVNGNTFTKEFAVVDDANKYNKGTLTLKLSDDKKVESFVYSNQYGNMPFAINFTYYNSVAARMVGSYKENLNYTMGTVNVDEDIDAEVVINQNGEKIDIVFPEISKYKMPAFTVENVEVKYEEGLFKISETDFVTSEDEYSKTHTGKIISGNLKDGYLTVNYSDKYGNMPHDVNFNFGKEKKSE